MLLDMAPNRDLRKQKVTLGIECSSHIAQYSYLQFTAFAATAHACAELAERLNNG